MVELCLAAEIQGLVWARRSNRLANLSERHLAYQRRFALLCENRRLRVPSDTRTHSLSRGRWAAA